MKQRSFGGGVNVSVLGVGCGRVGSLNNLVPLREIEAMLMAALEAGINLFDSADIYGQGDSERTLGRLLARHQGRMFITTKIGRKPNTYAGAIRAAKPLLRLLVQSRPQAQRVALQVRSRMIDQDFSASYLRRAADSSRRRLCVGRLDGLLLHDPPGDVLKDPKTADFLHGLLNDGTAAHVGVSACSLDEVEAALAIPFISILQVPVELTIALEEAGVADRIRQRDIALFVREVLPKSDKDRRSTNAVRAAVAKAISPTFVTAAIVGVSTGSHLDDLVAALP